MSKIAAEKMVVKGVVDASEYLNVSGILFKWVNFGKFWGPRWFTLQDGVLSYYKIHGPDKIYVSQDTQRGVRIIGEESQKLIRKQRNYHFIEEKRYPKDYGKVHIKSRQLSRISAWGTSRWASGPRRRSTFHGSGLLPPPRKPRLPTTEQSGRFTDPMLLCDSNKLGISEIGYLYVSFNKVSNINR